MNSVSLPLRKCPDTPEGTRPGTSRDVRVPWAHEDFEVGVLRGTSTALRTGGTLEVNLTKRRILREERRGGWRCRGPIVSKVGEDQTQVGEVPRHKLS